MDSEEFMRLVRSRVSAELLRYKHIQQIVPIATQTLYNERSSGRLVPVNDKSRPPLFTIRAFEQWMRITNRI
jgi:hypothetical protein